MNPYYHTKIEMMEINPKIIVVDDKSTIFMLQDEFNKLFPYLKIDLFPLNKQHNITDKFVNDTKRALTGYRVFDNKEQIAIIPQMSVAVLEEKFRKVYNLKAQILRKSGKTWLETTVTDAWTLEEQNFQGEALSKNIK
jgi:hypothetical protein